MADMPKVNLSPALTLPLAFGCKGHQTVTKLLSKHEVVHKVSSLKEHKFYKKAMDQKEILLSLLGLVLIMHGSHFKNLFLCAQVIQLFLYERVTSSVAAMLKDANTAREKVMADGPADTPEPTADAAEEKSKHAKKRDTKKAAYASQGADQKKEDAEATAKVLKILDSDKLLAAGTEIVVALLVCVLVMNGGIAQKAVVSYALVGLVDARLKTILEFPEHEDIQAWTRLGSRVALWLLVLPIAQFFGPLALILNASARGARFVAENGFEKLVQVNPDTMKGLMMSLALLALGTLWQLWSWAADGGLAWYFQLLYLPATIAEGFLGLLA